MITLYVAPGIDNLTIVSGTFSLCLASSFSQSEKVNVSVLGKLPKKAEVLAITYY